MWNSVRDGDKVITGFRNGAQRQRVRQVRSFYKAQAKDNFLNVTNPDYAEVKQSFPGFYGKKMNTWDGVAWSGVLLDDKEPCESELPPFSFGELVLSRNGEARFTSEAYQVYDGYGLVGRYQCDKGSNCKAFSYYQTDPRIIQCGCEGKWFRQRGRLSSLETVACSKPPTFESIQKYSVTRSTAVELGGDELLWDLV